MIKDIILHLERDSSRDTVRDFAASIVCQTLGQKAGLIADLLIPHWEVGVGGRADGTAERDFRRGLAQ